MCGVEVLSNKVMKRVEGIEMEVTLSSVAACLCTMSG